MNKIRILIAVALLSSCIGMQASEWDDCVDFFGSGQTSPANRKESDTLSCSSDEWIDRLEYYYDQDEFNQNKSARVATITSLKANDLSSRVAIVTPVEINNLSRMDMPLPSIVKKRVYKESLNSGMNEIDARKKAEDAYSKQRKERLNVTSRERWQNEPSYKQKRKATNFKSFQKCKNQKKQILKEQNIGVQSSLLDDCADFDFDFSEKFHDKK